jgi:hypothetical protein
MRRSSAAVLLLGLLACARSGPSPARSEAAGAQADAYRATISRDSLTYVRWNLPRLAQEALFRRGYLNRYALYLGLNPYYQRGTFDADTILDVAVQVTEIASGKRGIAIIHGGDSTVHILGAGTPLGNGGDDFQWLWVWRVEPRTIRADVSPVGREVLYVEKPESAGGLIWWNGHDYVWTQHGD